MKNYTRLQTLIKLPATSFHRLQNYILAMPLTEKSTYVAHYQLQFPRPEFVNGLTPITFDYRSFLQSQTEQLAITRFVYDGKILPDVAVFLRSYV
jgi:hypothetical protein